MKKQPFFYGSAGFNNVVEPADLSFDPETGVTQLSMGVNIRHTPPSTVHLRHGVTPIDKTYGYHSAFCDKGHAFVVQDRPAAATPNSAIMLFVPATEELVGVRSGLTLGARVSFCKVPQGDFTATYYANGHENGMIVDGVSTPWPANDHVGAVTSRHFSGAPVGTLIAWFAGRIWIVVGDTVYYSEPYATGKFNMARCFIRLPNRIVMLRPVEDGIYISDIEQTYFFRGTNVNKDLSEHIVYPHPALEWSAEDELVKGTEIGLEDPGLCALWISTEGACIGTPSGAVLNISKNNVIYPEGITQGASLLYGLDYIQTMA